MQDLIEQPATQESPFDALRLTKADGSEYWSARDLQGLLGYVEWRKFKGAVERAKASARNSGVSNVEDQFVGSDKPIINGKGRTQQVIDFHLSRYAAYLVAMNGEPSKPEIAAAQHYFAVKTREAEVGPKAIAYETLEPAQLRGMAHACRIKGTALDELATLLLKLKDADQRYAEALDGIIPLEYQPEIQEPAGKMSRTELAVRYLVPENLRKSEDGMFWVTSYLDVSKLAFGIPPYMASKEDHAEARRILETLGWEPRRIPGSHGMVRHVKRV